MPGDFTQSDLATDDVMILDTWAQVRCPLFGHFWGVSTCILISIDFTNALGDILCFCVPRSSSFGLAMKQMHRKGRELPI